MVAGKLGGAELLLAGIERITMTYPSFAGLAPSYARLWAELEPAPARIAALNVICNVLISHKATYSQVAAAVWGRPEVWFVVALIDQMEHDPNLGLCNSHLHNGDPLTARTVSVPAGRPPGLPPFTFMVSAADALIFDDLDKVKEWPIERIAYQLEKYNGGGYLDKPIVSPYLASWSNKYTAGKYVADHVYDPAAVSAQPGALTILKVLMTLDADVANAIAPQKPVEVLVVLQSAPLSPAQPKEAIMTTTTAVPALPAIPTFNLNTVEVDLEMIAPVITMIAGFIPGGAIVVPFIPIVETGLKMAAAVQAAPDAVGKLAVFETHLHDIANMFGQAKTAVAPARTPVA